MSVVAQQLLLAVALYENQKLVTPFVDLAHHHQQEWMQQASDLIDAHRPVLIDPDPIPDPLEEAPELPLSSPA